MKTTIKTTKNKMKACIEMAELKKKKILKDDIKKYSKKYHLDELQLERAWKNFQETGGKSVDRRIRTMKYIGAEQFATKKISQKKAVIDIKTAGDILLEYITTTIKFTEICEKYSIAPSQLSDWIHELNVRGTFLGQTVLNPKKYAKIEVKDVIWYNKYPNTKKQSISKLTEGEKAAHKRVAQILIDYIPHNWGEYEETITIWGSPWF